MTKDRKKGFYKVRVGDVCGGNIPDEKFDQKGGSNDSVQRGIMFVTCRQIARQALKGN